MECYYTYAKNTYLTAYLTRTLTQHLLIELETLMEIASVLYKQQLVLNLTHSRFGSHHTGTSFFVIARKSPDRHDSCYSANRREAWTGWCSTGSYGGDGLRPTQVAEEFMKRIVNT